MRKIRLDVEALEVETFTTTGAAAGRGTVAGHDSGTNGQLCSGACSPGGSGGDNCFDPASLSGWDGCICPNQMGTWQAGC